MSLQGKLARAPIYKSLSLFMIKSLQTKLGRGPLCCRPWSLHHPMPGSRGLTSAAFPSLDATWCVHWSIVLSRLLHIPRRIRSGEKCLILGKRKRWIHFTCALARNVGRGFFKVQNSFRCWIEFFTTSYSPWRTHKRVGGNLVTWGLQQISIMALREVCGMKKSWLRLWKVVYTMITISTLPEVVTQVGVVWAVHIGLT